MHNATVMHNAKSREKFCIVLHLFGSSPASGNTIVKHSQKKHKTPFIRTQFLQIL